MHKTDDAHLFAIYLGDLFLPSKVKKGDIVSITDEQIVHRVVTVLRTQIGQKLILFDDANHYLCTIAGIKKNKEISLEIGSIDQNLKPKIEINFGLPLLKREALEETVYSLTEIGVTKIQLLITNKSQKNLSDKDLIRLHKIKIAAAEQSKNFNMPQIIKPANLETFCAAFKDGSDKAVLFDPTGKSAFELMSRFQNQKIKRITATIGPEGGLAEQEVQLLLRSNFMPCKLTETVLRAVQASAVGAGLLASML